MTARVVTGAFNNAEKIVEGWYWALRSAELKRGKAKALAFLGRELVVYRGEDGRVVALDAYCPHMGAHLAVGKVEGNSIRCLFHYWKFSPQGTCVEIPCQASVACVPPIQAWPVVEQYGLIWLWAGKMPAQPFPCVPELHNQPHEAVLGRHFVKNCHPNVVMINAIDAHHFNSVHHLPVPLHLEPQTINESCIAFRNTTQIPPTSVLTRVLRRFYKDVLTYRLCYWFGSTGAVTLGPDCLHFYIMFALRPTQDGKAEGQTILLTRKRPGLLGKVRSRLVLWLTRLVASYFARGDTVIFQTMRFNFRTPLHADLAILHFIRHVEQQQTIAWGLALDESA